LFNHDKLDFDSTYLILINKC